MYKINLLICDLCGTCASVCVSDCIFIYNSYIFIDTEKCVECGKCKKVCPVKAIESSKS